MDSSIVIAFRALVMLGCLILVPMAAIFGSAFPDVVRSVLVDRFLPPAPGASQGPANTEAPAFGMGANAPAYRVDAAAQSPSELSAPPAGGEYLAPHNESAAGQQAVWNQAQPGGAPGGFREPPPAEMPSPAVRGQSQAVMPASPTPGPFEPGLDRPLRTATQQSPAMPSAPIAALPAAAAPPIASQLQGDRFVTMERRLRDCGAAYYSLEAWGNDGGTYRFYCRMPVANNANLTKNFEATDRDALRAMTVVVNQVEAWRGQAIH